MIRTVFKQRFQSKRAGPSCGRIRGKASGENIPRLISMKKGTSIFPRLMLIH